MPKGQTPDYDRKKAIQTKRILNRNSKRADWPADDYCSFYIRPVSKRLKSKFKKVVRSRGENMKFVIQALMSLYIKQAKKMKLGKKSLKKSRGNKIHFDDPNTRAELEAFYNRLNIRFDTRNHDPGNENVRSRFRKGHVPHNKKVRK